MGLPNIAQVIKDPVGALSDLKTFECYLNDLRLDVLSSERVNYGITVTEKPVEEGFKITDASIDKPATLIIEAVLVDDVYNATLAGVDSLLNGVLSWQDKKEALYALKNAKKIVKYISPLGVFDSMLITDVSINRSLQTVLKNGFAFSMSLKEVRFVSSDISSIDYNSVPDSLIKKEKEEQKTANKRNTKKKKQNS